MRIFCKLDSFYSEPDTRLHFVLMNNLIILVFLTLTRDISPYTQGYRHDFLRNHVNIVVPADASNGNGGQINPEIDNSITTTATSTNPVSNIGSDIDTPSQGTPGTSSSSNENGTPPSAPNITSPPNPGNAGTPSGNTGSPPENAGLPSGNAATSSGNAGTPSGNSGTSSGLPETSQNSPTEIPTPSQVTIVFPIVNTPSRNEVSGSNSPSATPPSGNANPPNGNSNPSTSNSNGLGSPNEKEEMLPSLSEDIDMEYHLINMLGTYFKQSFSNLLKEFAESIQGNTATSPTGDKNDGTSVKGDQDSEGSNEASSKDNRKIYPKTDRPVFRWNFNKRSSKDQKIYKIPAPIDISIDITSIEDYTFEPILIEVFVERGNGAQPNRGPPNQNQFPGRGPLGPVRPSGQVPGDPPGNGPSNPRQPTEGTPQDAETLNPNQASSNNAPEERMSSFGSKPSKIRQNAIQFNNKRFRREMNRLNRPQMLIEPKDSNREIPNHADCIFGTPRPSALSKYLRLNLSINETNTPLTFKQQPHQDHHLQQLLTIYKHD
ncbi:hypothetical protein Trydic_g3735 [Trypoxylus dichotomus]